MKTIPSELLTELYKKEYRKLRAYAYRMLKDDQRAEDAAHECFFRLSKQDYEKVKGHEECWLYTVCRNYSLKQITKNNRYVELFEEDRDQMDESRDPSEEMDMNQHKKTLMKLIKKLPPRQKNIIKLRFFKGFDYKETAKKLKTTTGNVGFHQSTAIQNLRKMMAEFINE